MLKSMMIKEMKGKSSCPYVTPGGPLTFSFVSVEI